MPPPAAPDTTLPSPTGPRSLKRPEAPGAGAGWLQRVFADRLALVAIGAVAVGIVLRFLWPSDMEYKGDEQYVYAHALRATPLLLGDRASVGIPNPGVGQWIYWLMAHLMRLGGAGRPSPVLLDRSVIALNALTLLALLWFVFKVVSARERQSWLYASALLAVNPMAILFSRKLWIQCLLAPFTLAALWGWWRRDTRRGAFAWGLFGLWLGQIHMSGLFFTAGFVLWTAVFARGGVRWRWWLLGSALGALSLIPWLVHLLSSHAAPAHDLSQVLNKDFWFFWVTTPIGQPIFISFGGQAGGYLAWPSIGGLELHLVGVAAAASVAAAVVIIVKALGGWVESGRRIGWRARAAAARSDTTLAVSAGMIGYGVLLTASGVMIYRHYITVAFILPFLFLALAGLRAGRLGRPLLMVILIAQVVMSVGYLSYIHTHGGASQGDYGYAYDSPHAARAR